MVPACYPSKISSTTGLREAVVYALPSVTGLVRWTDYIPVKLVASADAALEGRTDAGGFIPMDMLVSNTGLMGWVDYLPVYVDNSATDAWAITATGFIPYAASGGGSSPAFTVTMTALSNALGTVTTLAFITGGGGGGTPTNLLDLLATLTAGGSVTGTGGITTATTGIASRTTGTAPMAVFFDATATTNSLSVDSFHDCAYFWHFGDDGTAMWAYGTGGGGYTKNQARGAVAAHCYETAGTKTAKVTPVHVSSSGTLSYGTTTEISITVSAEARSGTTYIVSASGDFTGAPAGTQVTTGDIATMLGSGRLASNTRFLMKGGETFSLSSSPTINVSGVTLGKWGTGKPIITHTANTNLIQIANGVEDVIAMDLSLDASATANGQLLRGAGSLCSDILLLRVDVNANRGIIDAGFFDKIFVIDCNGQAFTGGNGRVGIYVEHSSRVAVLGTRVYDATAIEHCLRFQGSTKVVISNNYFYKPAQYKNTVTIRGRSVYATPSTWSGVWVEHVIVSDNVIDCGSTLGPATPVQFAPQNTGSDERIRDVICERNWIGGNAGTLISSEVCHRITIRNNILYTAATATYGAAAIDVIWRNTVGTPAGDSTYIYNNVCYQPTGSSAQFSFLSISKDGTADFPTGTVARNNLVYAPYATKNAGNSGSAPTFLYTGATSGYYTLSNNSSDAQIKSTAPGFTTPPTTYADWKAATGYSIDAGVYVPVFDDYAGVARTGTYDMGAYQP